MHRFRAVKFGRGHFGLDLWADTDPVHAARDGIGPDGILLVDTGSPQPAARSPRAGVASVQRDVA